LLRQAVVIGSSAIIAVQASLLPAGVIAAPAITSASVNLGQISAAFDAPLMAVDNRRQHVFVAAPAQDSVLVLGFDAALIATIPNETGASGILIDEKRNVLYVAQSTGSIDRIGLGSLKSRGLVTTGLTHPDNLVMTGGRIWLTEMSFYPYLLGRLASVDPETGVVTRYPNLGGNLPRLATSPALPDTLFVADGYTEPSSVYRIGVAGAAPEVVAANTFSPVGFINGLAVSPDGTRLLPSGSPTSGLEGIVELSASTLQADGLYYPSSPYPSAVAATPGQGGLVALGRTGLTFLPNIYVFPIGSTTPLATMNTAADPNSFGGVREDGLAFDSQGAHLFVLAYPNSSDDSTVFTVYSGL
jgi:hypothetical protein